MIRIPVDTNATARGGLVVASSRRATGVVRAGATVEAQDLAEGEAFTAVVEDLVGSKIYLRIDWASGRSFVPDYTERRPDPAQTPLEKGWEVQVSSQSVAVTAGAPWLSPHYAGAAQSREFASL